MASKQAGGKQGSSETAAGSAAAANPLTGSEYAGAEVIEQALPRRFPGLTRRPKRLREWLHLKAIEIRRANPQLPADEVQQRAEQALEELYKSGTGPELMREFEASAPTSESVRPTDICQEAEMAAARWLGPIRWLISLLLEKTNRRGFSASRAIVIACFLQMAFGRERPEILATHKKLLRGHTLLSWSHDYPDEGPQYKTVCESLEKMLHCKPARAAVHCNIELIRQLAERTGPKGKPIHPDIGKIGIVDGMLVESDVPQIAGKDAGHRRILRGPGREKVRPVVYTQNGNISRFCHGYKVLLVADMATTLPLVWSLMPASADERAETLRLLRRLFEMWPECPMEVLVGDSLYDHSKDFAHDLVFKWGIQPLFPRAGEYSRHLPHVDTDGIPVCACGELMAYKDTDGRIYDARKRAKEGIPRGQEAPRLDGRLRWKCVNGRCKMKSTRPVDDPRLYTFYHRGGNHRLAFRRKALLLRRNAVESIFASTKHLGLAGKGVDRPGWADDDEMDWLLSCGLLYQTARRLVHERGLYEIAEAEADELGLLEQPSEDCPAPGPTAHELAGAREAREKVLEKPLEPRSWSGEGDGPRAPV